MASQDIGSPVLREVILGIDLGSTSTRACLWDKTTNELIRVFNPSHNSHDPRYEKGDFSSNGYVFEEGQPIYLGDETDSRRRSISLKTAFYLFCRDPDNLLSQYRIVHDLISLKDDQRFIRRLRQGLKSLFSTVRDVIYAICEKKHLKVTSVGLTIPAQWTMDFEDQYRALVVDVFGLHSADIVFHTETEALAHFLLRDYRTELSLNNTLDVVIFLDFGGHNMNGAVFNVVQGPRGLSFYRIGDVFGAAGGSELWEYEIGQLSFMKVTEDCDQDPTPEAKQEILDAFNRKKMKFGPGSREQNKEFTILLRVGKVAYWLSLDPAEINDKFQEALQEPLRKATEVINATASACLGHVTPKVVISGGSCRNDALQSRLRNICAVASIPEPIFTSKLNIHDDTMTIATGAAYACGNTSTVQEFMDRGAGFGLQMRRREKDNDDPPWEDEAKFLCSKDNDQVWRRDMVGFDRVKIICDPFYGDHPSDDLHYTRCYDLWDLGQPNQLRMSFSMSLKGSGNSVALFLERSKLCKRGQTKVWLDLEPLTIPLYFERGTNCVHVLSPKLSNEELDMEASQPTGLFTSTTATGQSQKTIPGFKMSGSLRNQPRVDPYKKRSQKMPILRPEKRRCRRDADKQGEDEDGADETST